MAETTTVHRRPNEGNDVVERAKDFWERYNKPIMIIGLSIILLAAGYLIYKKFFKEPNELKASEAIFKAEDYYRMDSLHLALNGDGVNPGFLKIIDRYEGTKAENLSRFYAGAIYLQLGDAAKSVKHLNDFESDAPQIQARAYKLLGDAYAELGKNSEALSNYKKAAGHFEKDESASSEYLFMAAYFASRVLKNQKEATTLFKDLKVKYPRSERGMEADKYLAQLGVYN